MDKTATNTYEKYKQEITEAFNNMAIVERSGLKNLLVRWGLPVQTAGKVNNPIAMNLLAAALTMKDYPSLRN